MYKKYSNTHFNNFKYIQRATEHSSKLSINSKYLKITFASSKYFLLKHFNPSKEKSENLTYRKVCYNVFILI